ncbi:MFS transporter [Marinoscillum furvescens]|uniref:Putative MFS family arabinose efflux permease n=1 Tax=Marinoscillum furvescens DSM 4134 TaxID=1122208 RepID=A0A3D9L196_MARFU|nr:MFS transporter [Marinoscillum furvescens]RED95645.1 putative MFS family arabinose efflux permease [Marinoscillum furvescens DSM 4134]
MSKSASAPVSVLPIIVCSQFACTSLWFAGNAVLPQLQEVFNMTSTAVGNLTSSVQLGFIVGTLVFAFFLIADRYSPSKVFMLCAFLGAIFNLLCPLPINSYYSILLLRFITGFCLAGIYPVGMKIAADHFQSGLGKSLGYLVGALVLGTAFPHLLRSILSQTPWEYVFYGTSLLAIIGGLAIGTAVPDGPYRHASKSMNPTAIARLFLQVKFRQAAVGYFGHMWELYTFWAFVPMLLRYALPDADISLLSFIVIGSGGIGCILAGYLAVPFGSKTIATWALAISGICCAAIIYCLNFPMISIVVIMIWGISVVADSPLFSTLIAQNAPAHLRGSALTIVNSIGFGITIVSLQLLAYLEAIISSPLNFLLMCIGPTVGLVGLYAKSRKN